MDAGEISSRLQMVFIQMIPFLMAIVFHEVGHAIVARRYGDTTARDMGRLTLNPIPHLHIVGTIIIPVLNMLFGFPIMFGWANPVPINYNKIKPYRRGLFLVALAGPATNTALAFIASFVMIAFKIYCPQDFYLYEPLTKMAEMAVMINLVLAVFNLIPLPPLDGSKMIEAFLNYNQVRKYESLQAYSFIILIALFWTGVLGVLLQGPVNFFANLFVNAWGLIFYKLGAPIVL